MKQYLTEFIGTFFWVLVLGLSVSAEYPHLTALALGATIMGLVYMGQPISGAHYNPAITLAVVVRGGFAWKEAGFYVLAQLLGAFGAVALVQILVQDESFVYLLGLAGSASNIQALLVEIFLTFLLALVYLNVCTGKEAIGNSYFGLAVGGTLAGIFYVGHHISGGAFNPALGIAPNVLATNWAPIWIYVVGPLFGASLAGFVYRIQHSVPLKKPQIDSGSIVEEEIIPDSDYLA
ncbi:MAG: MIP/aquaporin family protein [Bacteroidia bacterium]